MPPKRVALVTGASKGIGAAVAARMAARGYDVFAASRSAGDAREGPARHLPLDVRDEASVRACVAEVIGRAGRIDVLVNNAGVMLFGAVEEVPEAGARDLFETNFWGVARMVNAVLPHMRAAGGGHIVNVGSIAGSVAIPMNGFYAATKHALVGYTEALRHEVMQRGIRVALVEPGDVRTRLWEGERVAAARFADYDDVRARVLAALRALLDRASDPHAVADAIVRVAESPDPALRNPVGTAATLLPRMRAFMPHALFEAGTRRRFGLETKYTT